VGFVLSESVSNEFHESFIKNFSEVNIYHDYVGDRWELERIEW
jgi:hypothetical protein